MSSPDLSILEQFRRNFVALVSLIIAVTSLSYTRWRNENLIPAINLH